MRWLILSVLLVFSAAFALVLWADGPVAIAFVLLILALVAEALTGLQPLRDDDEDES